MNSYSKATFTKLSKDQTFKELISKVSIGGVLNEKEWTYLLACSLILLEQYNSEKGEAFFQFAYYIVLKYSLSTNDYKPLYDLSVDAGFFPISNFLFNEVNLQTKLDDLIIESSVKSDFTEKGIVFIESQKNKMDLFLSDKSRYKSLIAPTSYGKSKFIEKDIREHASENKIAVIVPTKALIWQTFTNLKEIGKELKRKIIVHDTEYTGVDSFIGIFTQERALRLLEENNLNFDSIYVDEAHNLFEKDSRSILLARLLRINENNNPGQRVVFLSPLVEQSDNFSFDKKVLISENRINNSIKEYDIKYYDSRKQITCFYNRFINEFIPTREKYSNIFDYIFANATNKNLVYFYSPKKIERFSKDFCDYVKPINDPKLEKLASLVESYSDKEYLMVEMIKRGAIYIHSKVPDFLKNYLFDCFNKMSCIKYLISNGCVLEGVDFPIDSLFILDTSSLNVNKTINLVGRVNRLKNIFSVQNTQLSKLLCPIHYVLSTSYCSNDFENKIELLRSDVKDEISNPSLANATPPKDPDKLKEFNEIKTRENDYVNKKVENRIALSIIKNGVDKRYSNFNLALQTIEKRIQSFNEIPDLEKLMYAISDIFIKDIDLKNEYIALRRLKSNEAVNYYFNYLNNVYHGTLKAKIKYIHSNVEYIKKNNTANGKIFVGKSFGTTTFSNSQQDHFIAYVDVSELNKKDIMNIAVIKSKVEDDFLDFEIAPYVKIMFELEIINESLYNEFMYGTSDSELIKLYKFGFSSQFIKFITDNNLISEMEDLGYGIKVTNRFKTELKKQDEIIQFEINHYLVN